jgi:hypothetical protein
MGAGSLVLLTGVGILLHRDPGAAASTLSRSARGWLGARRVLEARGVAVHILDAPLETVAGAGVLVVSFPWQSRRALGSAAPLTSHLQRGGTLVLAFSGDALTPLEDGILEDLALTVADARPRPPLDPRAWRRYAREVWTLGPDAGRLPGAARPRVSALRRVPRMPAQGRALFTNDAGLPIVFEYDRWSGRVLVMPSEILANGRLAEAGNADWLATLAGTYAGSWTFDEYHHGLIAPGAPTAGEVDTGRFMDLYLAQIVLIYVLGLLAVGRRFGPAWTEPAVVGGSVARFLVGLGGMHARLGHHAAAAAALVRRAGELDKRTSVAEDAARAGELGPKAFLELAQSVGRTEWRSKG